MADETQKCDGTNHRIALDVVTFIEMPDEHFRTYITGNVDTVKQAALEFKRQASPSASLYFDYCCKECEEAVNE